MRTPEEYDRLIRLTGEGSIARAGGGVPLSSPLRAMLSLLRRSPVAQEELKVAARDTLPFKERRVLQIWGNWDAFCQDLLDEMEFAGVARHEGDLWYLQNKQQETYTVISDPPTGPAVVVNFGASSNIFDPSLFALPEKVERMCTKCYEMYSPGKFSDKHTMCTVCRPSKPEISPDERITCPECKNERSGTEFEWEKKKHGWWRRLNKCNTCRRDSRNGKQPLAPELTAKLLEVKRNAESQGQGKLSIALIVAVIAHKAGVTGDTIVSVAVGIPPATMYYPMRVARQATPGEIEDVLRGKIHFQMLQDKYCPKN